MPGNLLRGLKFKCETSIAETLNDTNAIKILDAALECEAQNLAEVAINQVCQILENVSGKKDYIDLIKKYPKLKMRLEKNE